IILELLGSTPSYRLFSFFFVMRASPRATLSLHDALPISTGGLVEGGDVVVRGRRRRLIAFACALSAALLAVAHRRTQSIGGVDRSEEHTAELQSLTNLLLRLLLEKKK